VCHFYPRPFRRLRSHSSGCQASLIDGSDNCGSIRATISRLTLTLTNTHSHTHTHTPTPSYPHPNRYPHPQTVGLSVPMSIPQSRCTLQFSRPVNFKNRNATFAWQLNSWNIHQNSLAHTRKRDMSILGEWVSRKNRRLALILQLFGC